MLSNECYNVVQAYFTKIDQIRSTTKDESRALPRFDVTRFQIVESGSKG